MKSVPALISLAGSQPGETRHVCAFFNNEEEYRVLLPFIKDGLKSGDKTVHVLSPEQREDHLQRLVAAGIDPAAAQQSGQLELRINAEVYPLISRMRWLGISAETTKQRAGQPDRELVTVTGTHSDRRRR